MSREFLVGDVVLWVFFLFSRHFCSRFYFLNFFASFFFIFSKKIASSTDINKCSSASVLKFVMGLLVSIMVKNVFFLFSICV